MNTFVFFGFTPYNEPTEIFKGVLMFKHQRLLSAFLLTAFLLPACKGSDSERSTQKTQTNTSKTVTVREKVAEGLDLSSLPELVAEAKTAEELENLLNTAEINNLDLNNDDQIDYLNVEEYREEADRGFLLYTQEGGQRTELAQVLISQQSETAEVMVKGNPEYYGNQGQYRSSFPLGQILLAGWLFNMARPRYYHPPYYAGSYPRNYRSRRPVSSSLYRSRLRSASSTRRSRLNTSKSRPTTTYKSTTTSKSGANTSSGTANKSKSLNSTQGNSFTTTNKKRSAGSGSSTTGSNSGSSFGSSSSRSRSTTKSSRGSSFGSSSSRRRSSSSSRRRR